MYRLLLRQQPVQGRMSGFSGTQNQRNIEPALILQVVLADPPSSSSKEAKASQRQTSQHSTTTDHIFSTPDWQKLICHVSLLKADGQPAMAVLNSTKSRIKNNIISTQSQLKDLENHEIFESLLGSLTNCAEIYTDLDGSDSALFIFGDLGVRSPGVYRLCIRLILPSLNGGDSPILDEVITEKFTIYSPKLYPGLIPPTDLSVWLSKHGAKISVRRQRNDTPTRHLGSVSPTRHDRDTQ